MLRNTLTRAFSRAAVTRSSNAAGAVGKASKQPNATENISFIALSHSQFAMFLLGPILVCAGTVGWTLTEIDKKMQQPTMLSGPCHRKVFDELERQLNKQSTAQGVISEKQLKQMVKDQLDLELPS